MVQTGSRKDQTIYDPLDLSSASYESNARNEAMHLSTALLVYYLLRGRTPLISQTQAFDSPAVLAAASGSTSADFRWLVRRGHIRVALFKRPTLIDAFVAALDNSSFVFLAWPELNDPNPTVDRGEIKNALLHRRRPPGVPDVVQARVEAILALNSSVVETLHRSFARTPTTRLATHLAAARAATAAASPVGMVLQRLVDLKSDQWSRFFAELGRMDIADSVRGTVLSVLDSCYNVVLGNSLGARERILRGSDQEAMEIMQRATNRTVRYEGRVGLDAAVKDFERVGWHEVMRFIQRVEDLSMNERERRAEASRLLVRIATAEGDHLGFAPLFDGLYQGVLWGGISAGLASTASSTPLSRRQVLFSFLAGFLPAFITTAAPVRPTLRGWEVAGLEKRYTAILQGTADK